MVAYSSENHLKISTVVAWDDINPSDNDSYTCNVLRSNHSILILDGKFEGIPENLLINVVIWLILLMLFTFLRKRAWDYGRIALVQKNEQRWTQVFYGEGSATRLTGDDVGSMDSVEVALHQDKGLFSWVKAMFLVKDQQILKRNGPDAIQYLSFQRHIIFFLIIVCICSLSVVLPVNYTGHLVAENNSFGRTTLSNVDPESKLLWIHIVLSFLFVPFGILVIVRFSSKLKLNPEESFVSRTLMISKIPKNSCDKNLLLQHFQEAYPDCVIQEVQPAYDVKKLIELEKERDTTLHAKMYCEAILKETGEKPKMRPYHCGRICVCPRCQQVDALEYYSEKATNLTMEVDRMRAISLGKPLGIAFITFQNESMAESVYKDHQKKCKCSGNPHSSSFSDQLKPHKWIIDFSPPPEDIFWENLAVGSRLWYLKAILIYVALFVLCFFFTTPTIIRDYLDFMDEKSKNFVRKTPILAEFLSTLSLLMFSVLLPVVVRFSVHYVAHWTTRSSRNHAIMVTTFIFLLFMIVILPLLQLTSLRAFLEWIFQKGESYRWKCVFISGNGAFFVNYVITASFIGTALELIRFPELFMYVICVCYSRSRAEQAGLRNAVLWEFEFGVQYAWFLLIFSVVIIYSLVCPLIAPFGLFYMCMKHYIDRHNIFFVYGPSKINRSIHATAINFVMTALILMQICLFFFLFLRNGWTQMSIVSLGICICTVMVFMIQISFHSFSLLSPIAYKKLSAHRVVTVQEDISPTLDEKPYMPLVLKRPASKSELYITNPPERSYGTNEDSITTTPDDDEHPVLKDSAVSQN